jgi:hypothetical protein
MSLPNSCVRSGPYCTVRYVTTSEPEQTSRDQDVEWLTPNPMDGKQPVLYEDGSPWHVMPHWAMVGGRAILVGLDIRSFVEPWIPDPDHPDGGYEGPRQAVDLDGGLAEVTQRVLRGISISTVRRESSAHLAEAMSALAASLDAAYPSTTPLSRHAAEIASQLTQSGTPRKRRPAASDDLLSRVAAYYNEAVARGSKTPVRDTEGRLREAGDPVSARGGRVQVRKWVQRARQKELIPPVQ